MHNSSRTFHSKFSSTDFLKNKYLKVKGKPSKSANISEHLYIIVLT